MKKEYFALTVLVILIIGSIINILHLRNIVNTMSTHLQAAKDAYLIENYSYAENELMLAQSILLNNDAYTHVFIRHSEIDTATDTFYNALSELSQKDASVIYTIESIQYHISSILSMEIPSIKSVL